MSGSFGERWRRRRQQRQQRQQDSEKSSREETVALTDDTRLASHIDNVNESPMGESIDDSQSIGNESSSTVSEGAVYQGSGDLLSRLPRPGFVSVTFHRSSLSSSRSDPASLSSIEEELGLVLARDENDWCDFVVQSCCPNKGLIGSSQAPHAIQAGDVLVAINGAKCRGQSLSKLSEFLHMSSSPEDNEELITLGLKTSNGHVDLVHGLVLKPPAEDAGFVADLELHSRTCNNDHLEVPLESSGDNETGGGHHHHQKEGSRDMQSGATDEHGCITSSAVLSSMSTTTNSKPVPYPEVEQIPNESWWNHHSCVQMGDTVVSMNGTHLRDMHADDARLYLLSRTLADPYVSILSVRRQDSPLLSREDDEGTRRGSTWSRIRRTTVAVSGGALVGAGVVMMATPLHPIGHAMAIGGVGVLGTEFEGPRRLMNSTRERLSSLKRGSGERRSTSGNHENGASAVGVDTEQNQEQQPLPSSME